MKILCYGDSNTYGYDPRSYLTARYPADIRWTGLLPKDWTVLNWGMNGREIPSASLWDDLDMQLAQESPIDLMTIMLGTNDLLQHHRWTPADISCRMENFLLHLLQLPALSKTQLLLIAPPPMIPGAWANSEQDLARSRQLTVCYAELADRLGIAYADTASWEIPLAYDGVHFLPEGHRAFADGLTAFLTNV